MENMMYQTCLAHTSWTCQGNVSSIKQCRYDFVSLFLPVAKIIWRDVSRQYKWIEWYSFFLIHVITFFTSRTLRDANIQLLYGIYAEYPKYLTKITSYILHITYSRTIISIWRYVIIANISLSFSSLNQIAFSTAIALPPSLWRRRWSSSHIRHRGAAHWTASRWRHQHNCPQFLLSGLYNTPCPLRSLCGWQYSRQ